MAKKQEEIPQQEEIYDISTAISVACDVTTILGYAPIVDSEIHDHLTWENDGEFDAFVCNGAGHLTCRDDLPRELYLALLGVTTFYNYRFNDTDEEHENISNHTH